jgi:2-amino-4-hydroxy-6-hydroxymethyldihydropteridine diphosphokinase
MRAYVGLGSNLGDRGEMIARALGLLTEEDGIRVLAVSTIRETDPIGIEDQPRFLNGAAAVETDLTARELLDRLLTIEQRLGRTRDGPRGGPRTIDLDLLLYGDEVVGEPGLQVPHPRLRERRFVLEPLHELDPELTIPGAGPVAGLLSGLE